MKKRSTLRFGIGAGFMMALAGLMGSSQASQAYVNTPLTQGATSKDMKATAADTQRNQYRTVHTSGGLDLLQRGEFGMSPMEYGMRYGHGNGKRYTNKLRCSHNSKVKNR